MRPGLRTMADGAASVKLLCEIAEKRGNLVEMHCDESDDPLINITLQGRHDTYPKRRGMTRVPELLAAGVNVAFGQDCCMDPWYSLGSMPAATASLFVEGRPGSHAFLHRP